MTNDLDLKQWQCEEAQKLLNKFFGTTNANEISETLCSLLDSYIQHSEEDRVTMANATTLVNKLSQLVFNLENLQTRKGWPLLKAGIPSAIEN
jgi:ribosome maturation protein Sdo1